MKFSVLLRRAAPCLTLCLLCASPAGATEITDPVVNNPTVNLDTGAGINAGAVRVDGAVFSTPSGEALPWNVTVFAGAGECLRLDVRGGDATQDLELVVVSPEGTVYTNDNRVPNDPNPAVRIARAPSGGWYTVRVANANGLAIAGRFMLFYGRYVGGNANCAGGTLPLN